MWKNIFFSRRLKQVRLPQVLMTVGKLFHWDAAATANEQSPALVRVIKLHFYHVIVRRAQCSCRLIRAHEFTQIHWRYETWSFKWFNILIYVWRIWTPNVKYILGMSHICVTCRNCTASRSVLDVISTYFNIHNNC